MERIPDPDSPGEKLKVLRTDKGSPVRAATAWIWSEAPKEAPETHYKALKKAGFNGVRIVLFDVWRHEEGQGKYDWKKPSYREETLAALERAVDRCSRNGLYAIINAHNRIPSGDTPKYDERLNRELWEAVAPRFAGRKHVLFELYNEPIPGAGRDGSLPAPHKATLQAMAGVYKTTRALAPETHFILLSPAGISGHGTLSAMPNLVASFEKLTGRIDWKKNSVGYHLYHADANLYPRGEILRSLHHAYPGWPSENNFPSDIDRVKAALPQTDTDRSVSFGKERFVTETCERLGLGWSHWHLESPESLSRRWPLIRDDAIAKGYSWKGDS